MFSPTTQFYNVDTYKHVGPNFNVNKVCVGEHEGNYVGKFDVGLGLEVCTSIVHSVNERNEACLEVNSKDTLTHPLGFTPFISIPNGTQYI